MMLAISNIPAGTIGANPAHAEPLAIKKRNQSSSTSIDDKPLTKARKNETVDNTQVKHKNRINDEPTNEFSHTLRKEITSEVLQKAKNSRNVLKQSQIPNAAGQPSEILPLIAQWSLKAGHGPNGIVKKVELKPGLEHAQLSNDLSNDKSLLRSGKTAEPQNSEPAPIVNQKQIGLKEIPPKTSQNPLSTKIPSNQDGNSNKIQMPEGRPPTARGVDNEQNGEGFAPQPLIRAHHGITTANLKSEDVPISNTLDSRQTPTLISEGFKPQAVVVHSEISSVGEKAAIVSTFNASGSQKILPLDTEELMPRPAGSEITNVIQKPAIADKPVVPVGRKITSSNPHIPRVQDQPSGFQFQAVRIVPEKSPSIAENAVVNKTAAFQPGHIQTEQLSGPLADDMTEQGPNSPGRPAYQHLHRAQLQISAGSIKGRNSSVPNNNADSDFEQVFSGNNAAAYIEEQTSAFPEAVKTDNPPVHDLPNNVSASITEQILESIQSSSSQQAGTQQITIRLHPPELGKVFIKFEEQENQLIGLVEVSKAQTRYEVEQALPQIIQNLADCGIQIKRLEVMFTDQNEQQSYGDESLQDGLFQQHHDLPGGNDPDSPGTLGANDPERIGNNSSYQDGLGPQMQITADSINILI
jgi:flagellar hook-length control protein FliK